MMNTLNNILIESSSTKKIIEEDMVPYTGIPAPVYLEDDDWFGPAPARSKNQLDYMVQEMEIKRQEREENFFNESDDIHQRMYEISTQGAATTIQLNPIGGSENFQDSSWMSNKLS
jgi:hypothetical protein